MFWLFFIPGMVTNRIGLHSVSLPINHKIYNFRGKKISQVMKKRENLYQKTDKGGLNVSVPMMIKTQVVIGWIKL